MNSMSDDDIESGSDNEYQRDIKKSAVEALSQSCFDYALRDIRQGKVSIEKILEDFRIYQAELEIQNEELKQSQAIAENSLRRFTNLFNALPLASFVIEPSGFIIDANEVARRTLKNASKSRVEFFPKIVLSKDHLKFSRLIEDTLGNNSSCAFSVRLKSNIQDEVVVDIFASKLSIVSDQENYSESNIALILLDRTKELIHQAKIALAATVFESSLEGIMITDSKCVIIDVNRAFTTITGYDKEFAIGKQPNFLQSGKHGPDFYLDMWQAIEELGNWHGEIWNKKQSGVIYPEHLTISSVKDFTGKVVNYIGVFSDITNQKNSEEEIARLAFYDPLTNLPNRRLFKERLKQAIISSNRNTNYAALIFIDLDDFKNINDSLGHDVGDQLLVLFSSRLFSCVREVDTVARLGGDEFVIVLEGLDHREFIAISVAEKISNKILTSMKQPFDLQGHSIHCTCSIGVTVFLDHENQEDELLKQADLAMYQSKKSGKNSIFFYDPKLQAAVNASLLVHNELVNAINNDQLELYYQLQLDKYGKPYGVEALVRWNHPEKGQIMPEDFIPIAEETGLIHMLGAWVILNACQQIKRWELTPVTKDLIVSINVGSKQFQQHTFVEQIKSAVQQFDVLPSRLSLEITEHTLINNVDLIADKIKKLKKFGVAVSLDDFGTGYSSLKYLSILPVDYIKIDQTFVSTINPKNHNNSIVTAIIAIARSLNIKVISEGIESKYQYDFLNHEGSDFFQGFYLSKPLPVGQFENFCLNL